MEKDRKSHKHQEKENQEEQHYSRYLDSKGNPIQFSLWVNDQVYKIPVPSMIRVSKRCLSLAKSNEFQGSISHPVSKDALTAFLLACELKPFKVTASNAFELLELSQEWGIRSLESFVNQYIQQKNIKQPKSVDHLGRLLSNLERDDADVRHEIANVARNFNQYIVDDRLSNVHPEHLFHILSQAEKRPINQDKLVDFVMKLFDTDPDKAIPLSLKINFDFLTEEQLEKIFQTREFHEQSIGYFVAKAISDSRNTAKNQLTNIDIKYLRDMSAIRDHVLRHRTANLKNLEESFSEEVKELKRIISVQQKQINQLKKTRDLQRKAMSDYMKSYKAKKNKLDKEFQRIDTIVNEIHGTQNDRFVVIKGQIDERVAPITKFALQSIVGTTSRSYHKRDLIRKAVEERRNRYIQNYEDVAANVNNLFLTIKNVQDKIQETRATFASKVVRDQFRQDSFLRNIENQFNAFDIEPRIWELTSDIVRLAQVRVEKMESRVRSLCPVTRGAKF